jgi:hypothetical protein
MAPALAIAPIAACSEYAVWLYVVKSAPQRNKRTL